MNKTMNAPAKHALMNAAMRAGYDAAAGQWEALRGKGVDDATLQAMFLCGQAAKRRGANLPQIAKAES